jgi:hypothetical protein
LSHAASLRGPFDGLRSAAVTHDEGIHITLPSAERNVVECLRLFSERYWLTSPSHHTHIVPRTARSPRSWPPSTRLNSHSRSCSVGCPTSRDFVPWRFSDACCWCPWVPSSCRRPRNLVWGDFCQGGAPRVLSIFLSLSFFVRPGQARFFIPTIRIDDAGSAQERSRMARQRHRRLRP